MKNLLSGADFDKFARAHGGDARRPPQVRATRPHQSAATHRSPAPPNRPAAAVRPSTRAHLTKKSRNHISAEFRNSRSKTTRLCSAVLTLVERYDQFQGGVCRGKPDNFYILQACFSPGGDHVILRDALLPLGINNPKRCCALHGLRNLRD